MWHPDTIHDASGHLDEGVVHAWLDGELAAEHVLEIEAHIAACSACAARVAEARGLVAGARRVLGALDAQGSVVPPLVASDLRTNAPVRAPVGVPPRGRAAPRWTTRRVSLAAAAVLMFAAGSLVVRDRPDRELAAPPPIMTTEATSAQAPSAPMPLPPRAADSAAVKKRERPVPSVARIEPRPVPLAPPPPPAPAAASAAQAPLAQAAEPAARDAMVARIGGAPARSAAPLGRMAAPVSSAPVAEATTGAVAGRADRPAMRSDSAVRRRLGEGTYRLEGVVATTRDSDREEKAGIQVEVSENDVKLIGCWRVGASDSLLLLDTLPRASSLFAAPRRRETIFWRGADTARVIHVRPVAPAAANTSERAVSRAALVRVACP